MIPVLMYIPPQNKTVKEQASCRNKESVVREYSRNNGILGESISFSVYPIPQRTGRKRANPQHTTVYVVHHPLLIGHCCPHLQNLVKVATFCNDGQFLF